MAERIVLRADEGMVLTDGANYGRIVYLAEGVDPAIYHQITEAEYEAVKVNAQAEEEFV